MLWNNRWWQEGKEVVGKNNLGVVQFRGGESEQPAVLQDLYWYASWKDRQIVYSRFEAKIYSPPSLLLSKSDRVDDSTRSPQVL